MTLLSNTHLRNALLLASLFACLLVVQGTYALCGGIVLG